MTVDAARAIEVRYGATYAAFRPDRRRCVRCGETWPRGLLHWTAANARTCRACRSDEAYGIYPIRHDWHRKNRWTAAGHLERRCCDCREWKPLTSYYLLRNGAADPICTRCRVRRATHTRRAA